MMKYFLLLFALLMTKNALGCHCVPKTADEYLSKCDQLFTAKVVESKVISKVESDVRKIVTEEGKLSSPIKVIKGNELKVVSIRNSDLGSSCDSPLVTGGDYVVCVVNLEPLENFMCGYTHYLYEGSDAFIKNFNIK